MISKSNNYTNPAHRRAFEAARTAAAALDLDELQASDSVEKIAQQIRVLPTMYQKRRLCTQIAGKAIQTEIERRNGHSQ